MGVVKNVTLEKVEEIKEKLDYLYEWANASEIEGLARDLCSDIEELEEFINDIDECVKEWTCE